jgi:hypothetical protein
VCYLVSEEREIREREGMEIGRKKGTDERQLEGQEEEE